MELYPYGQLSCLELVCFTGGQPFIHDQSVYITLGWMLKCLGQASYGGEAEFIPESYCASVTGGDKVELHGFVAQGYGDLLGMFAHGCG